MINFKLTKNQVDTIKRVLSKGGSSTPWTEDDMNIVDILKIIEYKENSIVSERPMSIITSSKRIEHSINLIDDIDAIVMLEKHPGRGCNVICSIMLPTQRGDMLNSRLPLNQKIKIMSIDLYSFWGYADDNRPGWRSRFETFHGKTCDEVKYLAMTYAESELRKIIVVLQNSKETNFKIKEVSATAIEFGWVPMPTEDSKMWVCCNCGKILRVTKDKPSDCPFCREGCQNIKYVDVVLKDVYQ